MDGAAIVRRYHEETSHSSRPRPRYDVPPDFRPMDPRNRPGPFKHYIGLARVALPADLDPPADAPAAVGVLSGAAAATATVGPVNETLLARLLYFSNGVTRAAGEGADRAWFRASASAGNLHPLELYVACGHLGSIEAGLYHFDPESFGLDRLRAGDVRPAVAAAAIDTTLADVPFAVVITGIPWRTVWKYGERGWRHVWWDAGSLLANLVAVADAHRVPIRVLLGFVDADVAHVLGIDGTREFPVAVVAVAEPAHSLATEPPASPARLEALTPTVEPIAPHPTEFPGVADVHRATSFERAEMVVAWRDTAQRLTLHPSAAPRELPDAPAEAIGSLILRRGSTRLMARQTVPATFLHWPMAAATRPVPADAVASAATLLTHELAVHGVDGVSPGLYHWRNGRLEIHLAAAEDRVRDQAAYLCLGQPLGGDSAYTVFECADLDAVLDGLGPRGYRAALIEAGLVNGRLLLAAHALGVGATGLTFFDDEVQDAFATRTSCLLVTAVGVPAYQPTAGGPPRRPVELTHFESLMARLDDRFRQSGRHHR